MFEGFTDSIREVVEYARQEARKLNCLYVDTHHLLLGLIRQRQAVAEQVLQLSDTSLEAARCQVIDGFYRSQQSCTGIIFTAEAEMTLAHAVATSRRTNHAYVGVEHLVFGLVETGHYEFVNLLFKPDVDLERLHAEVLSRAV